MNIIPIVAIAAFAISKFKKSSEVSNIETPEVISKVVPNAKALARALALKKKLEEAKTGKKGY